MRGGCHEGEKQRVKGKQEDTAEKPQREEEGKEGEEEPVDQVARPAAIESPGAARKNGDPFRSKHIGDGL